VRLLRCEAGPSHGKIPTEAGEPHPKNRREPVHRPVLLRETLDLLRPEQGGLFIDCTVGLGGHAEAILSASDETRLIGLDRDAESLRIAAERLSPFGERVELLHAEFRSLPEILAERGSPEVRGILADLGISSHQLSQPERGFSFQLEGPLDMRMDRSVGRDAARVISESLEKELARIIFEYGEERRSRRIAAAIVRARRRERVRTTTELAAIVARAVGRSSGRIHPATRTFQAIRIHVNGELDHLEEYVEDSARALSIGGRLVVLTFHSLEDRIMKRRMRWLSSRCSCSKSLPQCACGRPNLAKLLTRKPIRPSAEEVRENPRSRSAKLRAAERI
jgi:16S rRNA (cytosine1402-N4)-methyltransferase